MNDPHVQSLQYRLRTNDSSSYKSPPPVQREEDTFRVLLENDILTFHMKEHHASAESAKKAVAGFLRSWEIHAALSSGRGWLKFEFDHAEVIDRDPPPPECSRVVQGSAESTLCKFRSFANAHVVRRTYPDPPTRFVASQDVKTMWHHFEEFLDHRERLVDMAYFCLTVIQERAGNRQKAASKYAIHLDVLQNVGRLSSGVGDERTGRKFNGSGGRRSHTHKEIDWLTRVVQAIIRRVGEYDADPTAQLRQIIMSDLPQLSEKPR